MSISPMVDALFLGGNQCTSTVLGVAPPRRAPPLQSDDDHGDEVDEELHQFRPITEGPLLMERCPKCNEPNFVMSPMLSPEV